MKINRFWFGVLLALSIMIIPLAFQIGDIERGFDALGGEIFAVALPFLVIRWREWSIEKALEERKNKSKKEK